jgi:hypothetical protein
VGATIGHQLAGSQVVLLHPFDGVGYVGYLATSALGCGGLTMGAGCEQLGKETTGAADLVP